MYRASAASSIDLYIAFSSSEVRHDSKQAAQSSDQGLTPVLVNTWLMVFWSSYTQLNLALKFSDHTTSCSLLVFTLILPILPSARSFLTSNSLNSPHSRLRCCLYGLFMMRSHPWTTDVRPPGIISVNRRPKIFENLFFVFN